MYEIAVCDDDAAFAADLERQISRAMERRAQPFRLTVFPDPAALLQSIESGRKYDLLFLDIVFARSEQGIRFAGYLRDRRYGAAVVFMSANRDYAADSYDVPALHYLVKPVDQARLETALDRFLDQAQPVSLRFSSPRGTFCVFLPDILYFEIYSHEIVIHKTDGTSETCLGTLKELENHLPPLTFVRPHRSYLVNMDHIVKIVRYQIQLSSGDDIPVSKKLYQQVQAAFIDWADKQSPAL